MLSLLDLTTSIRAELADSPSLRNSEQLRDDLARRVLREHPVASVLERRSLVDQLMAELTGLGPLDELLGDDDVDEVMINAGCQVWIERHGRISRSGTLAVGQAEALLERILAPLGRRADRLHPIVDARLPDGSRLSAIIAPLAVDGLSMTIRRFRLRRVALDAFANDEIEALLADLVDRRLNLVVSGATSTGKTTLLNSLAARISPQERIVTVEDVAELRLCAEHVVRLECRPATAEGEGAISMRDLVRAALRLRPDRLIIGEVRGAEALDMLQALNTGHDGSMSTCHANGPLDALRRIESMVLQAGDASPLDAVREQLHSSVDVIVHVERLASGQRRIASVAEVTSEPFGQRIRILAANDRVTGEPSRSRLPRDEPTPARHATNPPILSDRLSNNFATNISPANVATRADR